MGLGVQLLSIDRVWGWAGIASGCKPVIFKPVLLRCHAVQIRTLDFKGLTINFEKIKRLRKKLNLVRLASSPSGGFPWSDRELGGVAL